MEIVGRDTFEQAVSSRLIQWERLRSELEQQMEKTLAASRNRIGNQIEKLEAKHSATLSKLKELDLALPPDGLRLSERPPRVDRRKASFR
jgi:hypothetical protein